MFAAAPQRTFIRIAVSRWVIYSVQGTDEKFYFGAIPDDHFETTIATYYDQSFTPMEAIQPVRVVWATYCESRSRAMREVERMRLLPPATVKRIVASWSRPIRWKYISAPLGKIIDKVEAKHTP